MKNTVALRVAGVIFLLVAVMHLLRVIFKVSITVAGQVMPIRLSVAGFVVALFLALWMFKSANTQTSPPHLP